MKKGFTLIELLAVIVILAIIALIATPIIINIINDSREESTKRSAELYMSAVEQGLVRKNMKESFFPTMCQVESDGNLLCGTEKVEVDVDRSFPTSGTIMFEDGKIVSYANLYINNRYVRKTQLSSDVILSKTPSKVLSNTCVAATATTVTTGNIPQGNYANGDEYICEVKDGVLYHFFVISKDGNNINLIMDRNVASDGFAATKDNLSRVAWISKEDYDAKNAEEAAAGTSDGVEEVASTYCSNNSNVMAEEGAITAINALKLYVSTWDNINNKIYSMSVDPYSSINPGEVFVPDPEAQSNELQKAIWTPYTLNQTMKARLMTVAEALENGCRHEINTTNADGSVTKTNVDSCPRYLTNYLQHKEGWVKGEKVVNINNIRGYWLLNGGACLGYIIHDNGSLNSKYTTANNHSGIRPVITLETSKLG